MNEKKLVEVKIGNDTYTIEEGLLDKLKNFLNSPAGKKSGGRGLKTGAWVPAWVGRKSKEEKQKEREARGSIPGVVRHRKTNRTRAGGLSGGKGGGWVTTQGGLAWSSLRGSWSGRGSNPGLRALSL